jgi:hypothetical protein
MILVASLTWLAWIGGAQLITEFRRLLAPSNHIENGACALAETQFAIYRNLRRSRRNLAVPQLEIRASAAEVVGVLVSLMLTKYL